MDYTSRALHAAIRAIQGQFDLGVFDDWRLARVLAFAPDADPIIRAIAAMSFKENDLPPSSIIALPALHDAVNRMIGMDAGFTLLASWVKFAPKGWGTTHAAALVNAVKRRTCQPWAAAALIGPCDTSARLLDRANDIAFALRHWGQSTPEDPTAWMHAISADERDRLIDTIRFAPYAVASCIPWLPPDTTNRSRVKDKIGAAIEAFAEASPTARARHAAFLRYLVASTLPSHLGALTRLACATTSEEVWSRVQTLIWSSPDDARNVVAAAPWKDLDATVRAAILECADQSTICAAIAAAQRFKDIERITDYSAAAFFAALDPKVWNAHTADDRRRWLDMLDDSDTHLAVRSLGPHLEFLAKTGLNSSLVHEVQRYTPDDVALRWMLFPVALRSIDRNEAYALFNALPTPPPDPGAFFAIASEQRDPDRLARIRTTVRTQSDVQIALALRHGAISGETVLARCAALQDALRGRTWDDVAQFMPLLGHWDNAVLSPDMDAMVQRLARSDRQTETRQALDRLASLPPEVAVPTLIALNQQEPRDVASAATAIASALRAHGDLFLTIADTLNDADLRNALLPLPKDAAQADALRALARDDPLSAHRLAHALGDQKWVNALHALLTAPPRHADAVWQTFAEAERRTMTSEIPTVTPTIAGLAERVPIVSLALGAVQADDADMREAAIAALATRSDALRAIWLMLPQEMRQFLRSHPALSDLTGTTDDRSVRRFRPR